MKTKDFLGMLFVVFVIVTGLAACSDDDGDWEPMKWKTEVKMGKEHSISVPVEGGTYRFTCTNYGRFWFSSIYEEGRYVEPGFYDVERIVGEWSWAEVKENVMTVIISPNDTGNQRSVEIGTTAGDIFDSFTFNQAGQ